MMHLFKVVAMEVMELNCSHCWWLGCLGWCNSSKFWWGCRFSQYRSYSFPERSDIRLLIYSPNLQNSLKMYIGFFCWPPSALSHSPPDPLMLLSIVSLSSKCYLSPPKYCIVCSIWELSACRCILVSVERGSRWPNPIHRALHQIYGIQIMSASQGICLPLTLLGVLLF